MSIIGTRSTRKILNEKFIIRFVCILRYFIVSLKWEKERSQLLITASYAHLPSIVMIYLVNTLSALITVIAINRNKSMKIVKFPCNPQETAIFNKVIQYTVGERIKEMIPYSNIGKNISLHFFNAFLMLLSLSLR